MAEIWKEIEGFEGYEVSNFGNVRSYLVRNSKRRRDIPNPVRQAETPTHCKIYKSVTLRQNGKSKRVYVHRLVAKAFKNNHENKPQVHHIDNDSQNNHADNLEWVTNSENQLHRADWKRPSGHKYVHSNRNKWRAYSQRLGFDKCFKTRKVAIAYTMQYY